LYLQDRKTATRPSQFVPLAHYGAKTRHCFIDFVANEREIP
jgi:hypothetical protein